MPVVFFITHPDVRDRSERPGSRLAAQCARAIPRMQAMAALSVNRWKLFTVQQDIDEVRPSYAETGALVKADANPACTVCGGKGWPHGWGAIIRDR